MPRPLVIAASLLLVSTGCQYHMPETYHVTSTSVIDGYGLGLTKREAAGKAWDDAIERANKLGYASFDIVEVERLLLPHFFSVEYPDGKFIRLRFEITGRTIVTLEPKRMRAPFVEASAASCLEEAR
ncbi:MAG: hypothetical protein ACPGYV_05065 [Phycisphaeraceae bacterium]